MFNWININKNVGKYRNNKRFGLWIVVWFLIDNVGKNNQCSYTYTNKENYGYMGNVEGICIELIDKQTVG